MPLAAVWLILCVCAGPSVSAAGTNTAAPRLVIYPTPPGEPASQDYEVRVNGRPVFCYTSYRFDVDSKTALAGRPVSPVSFCSFDHEGPVEVEVRLLDGLRQAGTRHFQRGGAAVGAGPDNPR